MKSIALKPGWLKRDTRLAAMVVLKHDIEQAERHIRNLNDEMADASSKLKSLRSELRRMERSNITQAQVKSDG